jgi:hypothetical protein
MESSQRSGTGTGDLRARLATLATLGAVLLVAGRAAGDDTIDRALLKQAPQVIRYLKEHGYKNVGVLKFRVKKGDEPASDHVGPLNLNLAGRLEVALVLADDLKSPLGIIRDADAVAATLPGANHLNKAGRRVLFQGRYPLAWGDAQVEPDAFLTGVAEVSRDRKRMRVGILALGKEGETLDKVAELTASTDAPTLSEAGESFLIRGFADGGRVEMNAENTAGKNTEKAVESAVKVKAAPETTPLRDPEAPVALEIRYDDQPVPLEIRDNKAEIREPEDGQKVSFAIRKKDPTPDQYGVVLLVNDVNTLFKQRIAPLRARKWILNTEHHETVIRGYQTADQEAEEFRVLSREESKTNAVQYGPAAGTITLVVFRQKNTRQAAPPLDDEGEDLAALSRGVLPSERPLTLAALKYQLRAGVKTGDSRGLIVEGGRITPTIHTVEFEPDPSPVMSVTISYYKP